MQRDGDHDRPGYQVTDSAAATELRRRHPDLSEGMPWQEWLDLIREIGEEEGLFQAGTYISAEAKRVKGDDGIPRSFKEGDADPVTRAMLRHVAHENGSPGFSMSLTQHRQHLVADALVGGRTFQRLPHAPPPKPNDRVAVNALATASGVRLSDESGGFEREGPADPTQAVQDMMRGSDERLRMARAALEQRNRSMQPAERTEADTARLQSLFDRGRRLMPACRNRNDSTRLALCLDELMRALTGSKMHFASDLEERCGMVIESVEWTSLGRHAAV
jgi:hypothetical protein